MLFFMVSTFGVKVVTTLRSSIVNCISGKKGHVTLFSIRIEAHIVPKEDDGSIASCWVSTRSLQTEMLKAQLFRKRSVPTFDRLLLVC